MHVAIITAGGAGMFCGSCMHDNTLARALMAAGIEVTLIPTYTPIRVDEENVSVDKVFLGGINIYLDTQSRLWRALPRFIKRGFDKPWVINLATKFGISNDAHQLGKLTVAMLQGAEGPQVDEVEQLVDFISDQLKPDVVLFSNALIAGVLPTLKKRYSGSIYCTLQGDDIFLEDLLEPYHTDALALLRKNCQLFDGFLTHSNYYREFMSDYLQLPAERFHKVALGIDFESFDGHPNEQSRDPFTVGYFARVCPEKGVHQLIEAFALLHQRQPNTKLKVAGYCGPRDVDYLATVRRQAEPLGDAIEFVGALDGKSDKAAYLKSLDVLAVPTVYRECKGLYVLESLANGVPVVQPSHGAFPEIVSKTGGGLLHEPGDATALAETLQQLVNDPQQRTQLATAGYGGVRQHYSCEEMARQTVAVLSRHKS
ncbi:glycosyltransferase family 4 protein [bacterium]|nr:glycosyltransferase family 4 protein [bacterium]